MTSPHEPAPEPNRNGGSSRLAPYIDFSGYTFRLPTSRPKAVQELLPSGGIRRLTETRHMPLDARIAYWALLVTSALGVLTGAVSLVLLFVAAFVGNGLLSSMGLIDQSQDTGWGMVAGALFLLLFSVALCAGQLLLTPKLRERLEWARAALTVLTVGGFLLTLILTLATRFSAGGMGWTDILSLFLVALLWLPVANRWFLGAAAPATGRGRA